MVEAVLRDLVVKVIIYYFIYICMIIVKGYFCDMSLYGYVSLFFAVA